MRSPRFTTVAAVAALAGILATASQAAADPRCQEVNATIYDKVVTEGCPPRSRGVRGRHRPWQARLQRGDGVRARFAWRSAADRP